MNWQGQIVNAAPTVTDRGISRLVDRPRRNFRVILRGPLRGKKVSLFARAASPLGPPSSGDPLTRPARMSKYRDFVREAFNERRTQLVEKLRELRREFDTL